MSIRSVVYNNSERISAENTESYIKAVVLAVSLVYVASTLAAVLLMTFGNSIPAGIQSTLRQVKRLKRKVMSVSVYGQAKNTAKKVMKTIFSNNPELVKAIINNGDSTGDNVIKFKQKEIGASIAEWSTDDSIFVLADNNGIRKTKIKIAMRVLKVIVALMTIALTLFTTFSKWQDDPEISELFSDINGVVRTVSKQGIGKATNRLQSAKLYRQIRNTPGVGSMLPRGGTRILL